MPHFCICIETSLCKLPACPGASLQFRFAQVVVVSPRCLRCWFSPASPSAPRAWWLAQASAEQSEAQLMHSSRCYSRPLPSRARCRAVPIFRLDARRGSQAPGHVAHVICGCFMFSSCFVAMLLQTLCARACFAPGL